MTTHTLRKTLLLKASPATVWAYLTEPDKLAIWFNRPDVPLLDGAYVMHKADSGEKLIWGEVRLAEPYARLHYTFNIAPLGGHETEVQWQLEEVDGGTCLSLNHIGLPAGTPAFDLALALDKGWEEHISTMRDRLHAAG